ncbi:MAG: Hsp20/alpha crystallin family protein [Elusimicrobiota bacterium]|jgi:HSP20 family protein
MNRKDIAPLEKRTAAPGVFDSLGRVFEDLFDLAPSGPNAPQIDIKETDKTVEVRAALPGVEKKDINIDLTENALAISCERREEKEEKGKGGWLRREQSYGRFYRSFTLPAPVKTGEAKAEYRDGVLKLTMPKQKAGKGRRIDIE